MSQPATQEEAFHTCHECALSVSIPSLKIGQQACCPGCGFVLTQVHKNAILRIIALSISALIFLVPSISFDFISIESNGLENTFSISQSFSILFENNYLALAILELVTVFIIPVVILVGLLYLLIPLSRGKAPPYALVIMRLVFKLMPWAMVEIFLIGVLVSLIKIVAFADIEIGQSFISFILFSLCLTIVNLHIDKHQLADLLIRTSDKVIDPATLSHSRPINRSLSIQNTWALLITAIIVFIPANVLPIMHTELLGKSDPSTIIGGVFLLWELKSYPIAIIIFIASVVVPVVKIIVLIWLNFSVQCRTTGLQKQRITLHRMAEFIGRWSMVDVFVVIILVSLIQLGNTISIYPGTASVAFSAVVVLTMLAAMSFEPKLIWNRPNQNVK